MRNIIPKQFKLWQVVLSLLAIANLAYILGNWLSSAITLVFFLLVPGYLLLSHLKHQITSRWEVISFSLGLSILLLMVGGLALNTLHAVGLDRPLTTLNIFIMLDIVTLALVAHIRNKTVSFTGLRMRPNWEEAAFIVALTLLPLLAIGGAIRLNNGGSNVLTMILFGAIPALFILLVARRKKISHLYPYAVLVMGLSVLLSTSLRGWTIVGHDIHHEFAVFQITSQNGFWGIASQQGDPYNACMSITILPTLIAKIISLPSAYIFKAIFQIIFAFGLVPIYLLIKKLSSPRLALAGSLIFISFPPFLNDMPFLTRQEIAFVFFGLVFLAAFSKIGSRTKTLLSIMLLVGLVLSHYSSSYVALSVLFFAWLAFKTLKHWSYLPKTELAMPMLSMPLILAVLLFTFFWNTQVTVSSAGLTRTIIDTAKGLVGDSSSHSDGVTYGFFAPKPEDSRKVLEDYAGEHAKDAQFIDEAVLPETKVGKLLSNVVAPSDFNKEVRGLTAKAMQVFLFIGILLLLLRWRKNPTQRMGYICAMSIGCIAVLILMTILPQLSVDYGVTRLFQQTLVLTALPIVVGSEFVFSFLGRLRAGVTMLVVAFLFLHLSGFVPQAIGGYAPQLALNNNGTYYDIYYVHKGELVASKQATDYDAGGNVTIEADPHARMRLPGYPFINQLKNPILSDGTGYLYNDYFNMHQDIYSNFLSGNLFRYKYDPATNDRGRIYSNTDATWYAPS